MMFFRLRRTKVLSLCLTISLVSLGVFGNPNPNSVDEATVDSALPDSSIPLPLASKRLLYRLQLAVNDKDMSPKEYEVELKAIAEATRRLRGDSPDDYRALNRGFIATAGRTIGFHPNYLLAQMYFSSGRVEESYLAIHETIVMEENTFNIRGHQLSGRQGLFWKVREELGLDNSDPLSYSSIDELDGKVNPEESSQ
jgi:hypothetical protein